MPGPLCKSLLESAEACRNKEEILGKIYILLVIWSTDYSGTHTMLRYDKLSECKAALEALITNSNTKPALQEELRRNSKCIEVDVSKS